MERDNLIESFCNYVKDFKEKCNEEDRNLYILTADLIRKDQMKYLGIDDNIEYIDVGIREQHMLGVAHGISQTDPKSRILINAGDAFLYRSLDQLNAISQSKSNMVIVGDNGGLSGSKNGFTHQSSGQPGSLLSMPGLRFLEPADSTDLINSLDLSFRDYNGPSYIRLHTKDIKPIENKNRKTNYYSAFESQKNPDITIIGSGLSTEGNIDAAKNLEKNYGIGSRVINIVNPKSLEGLGRLVVRKKPVLTVYNGNPSILHSSVCSELMKDFRHKEIPYIENHGFKKGTSGDLEDLMEYFKMDGKGITKIIKSKFPYLFEK